MLKIICGEAGAGKSTRLYEKIREDARQGRRVFLFVPDQFSFEAEKIVVKTIGYPTAGNVSVTMFSRAAQKLLHLYGETKAYADDTAKALLMTRALNTLASDGQLLYYRRQLKKAGFAQFALGIVSQLRGAGITPSSLRALVSADDGRLSGILLDKLNDICEIYTAYDALLSVSFDDRLDDVRRAAELIAVSEEFEGASCCFDGFDSFSGSQLVFIQALLRKANDVTFTLTLDCPDTEKQHFLASAKLLAKLKSFTDGQAELIRLDGHYRDGCKGEIVKARDPWQECDWICAKIRELLDEGYRCREIAVLSAKPVYAEILSSAMKKYEIPFFADVPEPLLHKSVVRFAIDTLRALSFETEDLLRYVKSGFVRHSNGKTISNLQADTLERICRRYDVRKKDWLRPFPEKIDSDGSAEEIRKSVVDPLRRLKRSFENADGSEMTAALCDFLCGDMDISKTIYGMCISGREDGHIVAGRKKLDAYSSLWNDAVTVFESAHGALRGYRPTLGEYTEIMTGIFASTQIAKPPQTLDAVTVGDVERSRFRSVRAVFLCGFNQGVFPRPQAVSGAFTGSETQLLAECGIAVGSDRETRYSSELFLLYRCVNLPEERLFVTFPALGETFEELSPSPYLENLKKRFSAPVQGADDFGASFYCRSEASARRYLAGIYSDPHRRAEKRAILDALGKSRLFEQRDEPDRHRISPEHAALLLSPKTYSPTAISAMNACKFGYFCTYGLGLREDEERGVNAMLSGSVVHYCLERLFTEFDREKFTALTDRELLEHAKKSTEEYRKEVFFGGFGEENRFSYQLSRLSELAARAAARIRDGMKLSGFVPEKMEKQVEFRFGGIIIKGVCDRLDISRCDSGTYLRVVDYKRGKKELPLESVYNGENLQMLLYLFGLCEEYGAKPSSVLYQPIGQDELAESGGYDRGGDAKEQRRRNERSHAAGGVMLNSSPERGETEALNEYYSELYGKTRFGYSSPQYISDSSFEGLKEYSKAYVNALAMQTRGGMASACPKKKESCDFCEYSLFCGHKTEEKETQ